MEYLISVATLTCSLYSTYITEEKKINCIDFMVNCAVDKKGDIIEKEVDSCAKKLKEKKDEND
jgi:hypothetical protein